ncbi:hypothetical protein MASR2M29_19440 [Spirochaetota bacterium]
MTSFFNAFNELSLLWVTLIFFAVLAVLGFVFYRFKNTRPYMGQLLVLSGICLVAIIFFILTFTLRVKKTDIYVTAATMPRVWIAALVPMAVLTLVSIFNGTTKADEPFGRWKLVSLVAVMVFSSVFLFEYIGYYLSSALFLVLMMVVMRERKWTRLVLVPTLWCVFTYFVFQKLLFMSLPTGKWIEALLG